MKNPKIKIEHNFHYSFFCDRRLYYLHMWPNMIRPINRMAAGFTSGFSNIIRRDLGESLLK